MKPLGKTTEKELEKLFRESDKYRHNLTPEQLDEMEEELYD